MSPEEQLRLLKRFAPILHFDTLERWRPGPVTVYLQRSTVLSGKDRPLPGTPPAKAAMREHGHDIEARLEPLKDGPGLDTQQRSNELLGAYGAEIDLSKAGSCYGRVINGSSAAILQYWLFYCDNPCVLPPGRHDGDWELVQIRLKQGPGGFMATHLTLAEHGKPVTEPIRSPGERVHVFVAVDSHACYFAAGANPIIPLSDVCEPTDPTGAVPAVELLPVEPSKNDWVHWSGRWGMDRGIGTWLALQLRLRRTPSFLRRLNKAGAGESPPSPAHQGLSWRFPRAFAARGTGRRTTIGVLQRLAHFVGHLTWPRTAPQVNVTQLAPGSYSIEAKQAGHFLRRVRMVSIAFREVRPDGTCHPLGMHSVHTGPAAGPFEIAHEGSLEWHAAGYNFLRQRGEPVQ